MGFGVKGKGPGCSDRARLGGKGWRQAGVSKPCLKPPHSPSLLSCCHNPWRHLFSLEAISSLALMLWAFIRQGIPRTTCLSFYSSLPVSPELIENHIYFQSSQVFGNNLFSIKITATLGAHWTKKTWQNGNEGTGWQKMAEGKPSTSTPPTKSVSSAAQGHIHSQALQRLSKPFLSQVRKQTPTWWRQS